MPLNGKFHTFLNPFQLLFLLLLEMTVSKARLRLKQALFFVSQREQVGGVG